MWIFYVGALIPVIVGLILILLDKKMIWWEWLIGAACSFLLALIFQCIAVFGMTADIETWSGQVEKVSHYPRWVERYEESHTETETDSDGKTHTHTYYTTEYQTHSEHWVASRNFGKDSDEKDIDQSVFDAIGRDFGGELFTDGRQSYSHLDGSKTSGDNNIYSIVNKTGHMYPVTTTRHFENRIKAAPTVFSFIQVPTNINVYPWPKNDDWFHSERLVGTASSLIHTYNWDCMNASLGPTKRVNVILVGFGNVPSDYGHYQESKWIGGKKNDLVICYGGVTKTNLPSWVYVFGWTEQSLVKENLQTIVLRHPINDALIPLISAEISKNYVIKDWHKFDYITIEPPRWSYIVYFLAMIITQAGLYIYFHFGNLNESSNPWNSFGRRSYGRFRY